MKNSALFLLLLIWGSKAGATPTVVHPDTIPLSNMSSDIDPAAVDFANTITSSELKNHLFRLASNEFEGRETGTEGQKKAADYLAGVFASYGLPRIGEDESYFQQIAFTSETWSEIKMEINGKEIKSLWDFYAYPSTNSDLETTTFNNILFLGFGIDDPEYSDYEGVDVQGKAILIYDGEPVSGKGVSLITGVGQPSEWSTNWRKKLEIARKKGVSAVFFIDRDFKKNLEEARKLILNRALKLGAGEQPESRFPSNYFLSTEAAKLIIGPGFDKLVKARDKIQKKGKGKPISLTAEVRIAQKKNFRQLLGENVLGYIEGTDPQRKEELVVITAHYDHLGKRGDAIYFGADDNASGTSAVLEVAQAFSEAKKQGAGPKRSVLIMLVSGEEKGLLGSRYYVQHPVFPLENTIVNVNVDMVGRVDKKHEANPNYIYVIGSDRLSTELHQINEMANATYTQLELDYTYNAEDDPNRYYYRSDHYNFAEKGIPAIFYFNGTHDDYHRTSDTPDRIRFDKMETIARLVFFTSWELANREERIKVDVK